MIRNFGKHLLVAIALAAVPAFPAEKHVYNQASSRIVVVYWDTKNKLESIVVEKGSVNTIPVKSADDIPFGIYVIYDKSDKNRMPVQALWYDQWNSKELQSPVYRVDDKGLSPSAR